MDTLMAVRRRTGSFSEDWIVAHSHCGSLIFPSICSCLYTYKTGKGFCWLHTVTSSTHWGGLQPSVKRSGQESTPPSLRLWSSARKQWIAPSGLGERYCPKQRSSSIWGVKWSMRWTVSLAQHQQWFGHCTGLSWWRANWARRQSSWFTSPSLF